jgi:hypothetical protein
MSDAEIAIERLSVWVRDHGDRMPKTFYGDISILLGIARDAINSPLAKEVNRRRGEMAGLRETLRENEVQAATILGGVYELLTYKQAMDSMAAQMIHPKMTGLEMAKMQLGIK